MFDKLSNVYISSSSIHDILTHNGARGKCYIASAAIALAMESQDLLVNGNFLPKHKKGWHHQWVEFYFDNKWYVLDSTFVGVYERNNYYSVFNPTIIFIKSNYILMQDDFARKHAQIIRLKAYSHDLNLFGYYLGKNVERLKKDLYENIELDEQGNVKAYNSPYMWF